MVLDRIGYCQEKGGETRSKSRHRLVKGEAPAGNAQGRPRRESHGRLPGLLCRARRDVDKVGEVETLARCGGEEVASARGDHHGRGQVEALAGTLLLRRRGRDVEVLLSTRRLDGRGRRGGEVQEKIGPLLSRLAGLAFLCTAVEAAGLHGRGARRRGSPHDGARIEGVCRQEVLIVVGRRREAGRGKLVRQTPGLEEGHIGPRGGCEVLLPARLDGRRLSQLVAALPAAGTPRGLVGGGREPEALAGA